MVRADQPTAGPLLERAAEVATIPAAIDAALAGSGSVLLVEGAAGIGKTRLLAHACERAAAAGMTVLTARAALPEAVLVMSYADASGEAWHSVRGWQELARQRGRPLAAGIAASIAAHLAVCDGDIRQALAFGEQALAATGSHPTARPPARPPGHPANVVDVASTTFRGRSEAGAGWVRTPQAG